LRHGNCVGEEENLRSEEMEWRWTVADPEVWNRGSGNSGGGTESGEGAVPSPKIFWKI